MTAVMPEQRLRDEADNTGACLAYDAAHGWHLAPEPHLVAAVRRVHERRRRAVNTPPPLPHPSDVGDLVTATAQGSYLACDYATYATCTKPSTVEIDAWAYCAEHAGKAHEEAAPRPRPRPTAVPARTVPVPPILTPWSEQTPITELLKQAAEHSSSKVRRAGERIDVQLGDLRTLIRDLAADEAKKKAAAAAQQKAREDIARLEKQLADAKAALKATGGSTTPTGKKKRTHSPAALEALRTNAATARAARAAKAAKATAATPANESQEPA